MKKSQVTSSGDCTMSGFPELWNALRAGWASPSGHRINLVDRPNEEWIVGTGSAYAGHSMAVNINTAQVGDLDTSSASGWSRGE